METYSAMNHKPSTRDSYQSALDLHLNPEFGDKDLDKITRTDIKAFINKKRQEGLSVGGVRNLKAYLSSILSEAVDDELIPYNPAAKTGKMVGRDQKPEIRPFSWQEKNKFEKAVKEHYPKYYPFFLTALRTGMRLGELLALKPGDLDFNGGFIEVRRSFTKVGRKMGRAGLWICQDSSRRFLKNTLPTEKRKPLKMDGKSPRNGCSITWWGE